MSCQSLPVSAAVTLLGLAAAPRWSLEAPPPPSGSADRLISAARTVRPTDLKSEREVQASEIVGSATSSPVVGSAWGGAVIDHEHGSTLELLVTTEAAESWIRAQGLPKWVTTRRVRWTIEDLRRSIDDVRSAAEEESGSALRRLPDGQRRAASDDLRWSGVVTLIDIDENRAVVRADSGPAWHVLEAVRRAGKLDDRRVAVERVERLSSQPTDDACDPGGNCFPLRGGIRLDSSTGSYCTTSFTLVDDTGSRFTSTASHCNASPWSHNGLNIGATRWTQDSAAVDLKIINVDTPAVWKTSNTIWRPGEESFAITGTVPTDQALVGSTVCNVCATKWALGHGGGESCGTLTSIDGETGSWKSPGWDQMGVATYESCSGDSGGPVFSPSTHRAFGWNRGRAGSNGSQCSTGGVGGVEVMFTWVANGLAAANGASLRRYSVLTSP